jgi:hypothetical protein
VWILTKLHLKELNAPALILLTSKLEEVVNVRILYFDPLFLLPFYKVDDCTVGNGGCATGQICVDTDLTQPGFVTCDECGLNARGCASCDSSGLIQATCHDPNTTVPNDLICTCNTNCTGGVCACPSRYPIL